ncbi:MAG: HEAT repeat domain-containing protein [Planctomycetes bacterium]|nr:HEAT repeat domain-containing protein [Planctomycetota bacterium]
MLRSGVVARALVSLLAAVAASPDAVGHGGLFRQSGGPSSAPLPPSGSGNAQPGAPTNASAREAPPAVPGSAPSLPFSEERWEFWWEFNQDAYVNLRPSLRNAPVPAGKPGFVPLAPADRAQILLPALVQLLRDEDDLVRSAAVYSLARLEDESTLPYLSNTAVSDPSLSVRINAILSLGLARNPKATERLRTSFLDEHQPDELRAMAAVALGVSGVPAAGAVLRDALAGGVESRLPHTLKLASIYALGLARDPGNAPFLHAYLQARGHDDFQRALAIEALGRIGDRAATPTLVAGLSDDATPVRRSAAIALGVVGRPDDADAVRALERTVNSDADGVARSFATLALGRIASLGAPQIVDRLKSRLKSAGSRERPFLALAIGLSGYQTALPELMAQFHDDANPSIRGAIAVAIALLDQREAGAELLAAFKKESDPALRGYLAWALGRLKVDAAAPELREQLAKSNEPAVLYWTALGLGLLGDRSAVTYLDQLYQDDRELVARSSYLLAIGTIGDKESASVLLAAARKQGELDYARAYATASLGMLCDETQSPLPASFARDHNYTMSLTFLPDLYYLF